MTTTPITARQREVLQFLRDFHGRKGYMPTRGEIADGIGFKSANSAEEHLQALRSKGFVITGRATARALQLTPAALELLGAASPLPTEAKPDMLRLPVVDMARVNRGAFA